MVPKTEHYVRPPMRIDASQLLKRRPNSSFVPSNSNEETAPRIGVVLTSTQIQITKNSELATSPLVHSSGNENSRSDFESAKSGVS